MVDLSMVQPPLHGEEVRWQLASLLRFRRLNLLTEPYVYPLLNMLDFPAKASDCTVFSKVDLRKGPYQIPCQPS